MSDEKKGGGNPQSKPRAGAGKTGKAGNRRGRRRRKSRSPSMGPIRTSAQFKAILGEIGIPEEKPFLPDPYQEEALERFRETDVLVAAPTGAGKTWIAQEAIRSCLEQGGRAWYACPLKALSNAKLEEFSDIFGPEMVGILTGDRKDNSRAPIIVGTTEILRNQLYDTMSSKVALPYELVILDEAHYLGEAERGVVWEETLIYLPPATRLLMLSATIKNTREIADWLGLIRGVTCSVVTSLDRPVPLHPLFLYPGGAIGMLAGKKGLAREVERCLGILAKKRSRRFAPQQHELIIRDLRRYNLLPAIFFLKSRAECDRAVSHSKPVTRDPEDQEAFERDLESCLERFPYLRGHRSLLDLQTSRVAAHHAGHLPAWKVLVEQMMLKGHLEAIFATSTVAGGVNFPARTVVLIQSDRFNGKEFQELSATDLQQMIGRAGRRGKDLVGFALVVPGPYQDPGLILRRFSSPPDPIESQLRINFSMVLNLLPSHLPEEVRHSYYKQSPKLQQYVTSSEDERLKELYP